jgi:hypothetical protein
MNDGASQHAYGHICWHACLGHLTLTQVNCHTSTLTSSSSTLPMFIIFICRSAIPENPASHCFLMATILWGTPQPP